MPKSQYMLKVRISAAYFFFLKVWFHTHLQFNSKVASYLDYILDTDLLLLLEGNDVETIRLFLCSPAVKKHIRKDDMKHNNHIAYFPGV